MADYEAKVRFEELGTYTDIGTGKPVANVTRYTYTDGGDSYIITFTRHRDLAVNRLIDELHGTKKAAARLLRFDAPTCGSPENCASRTCARPVVDSYTDPAI